MIFTSPKLMAWMQHDLMALESTWNLELSPAEQIDGLVEVFCSGDTLTYDHQFKPLTHVQDGIWELKTADLRMFGWFSKKDCFLGVVADATDRIKRHNLYYGYAGEVARYRVALDLDDPKFVPGDDPHAVVSDYTYP